MEVFLIVLILFSFKRHRHGFSHFEEKSWNQVFFIMENSPIEVFIDGEATGLRSSGILYFPPQMREVHVEYLRLGAVVYSQKLTLNSSKNLVWGVSRPLLSLLAK